MDRMSLPFRRFQIEENSMRTLRTALAVAAVLLASGISAQAQTKVAIGKVLSGNGFHIPTYVAMDRGFYKEEGLDARFVQLSGSALVKAALTGAVDFIPIPSGGSQAALSGAEIRYVVGQSLKSQWLIAVRPEINKPEDLKGKIIGYGRAGSADYDEGAAVLSRFFKMDVAKDYKVISFQGETERIAALVNGDIQAALISVPHAPKALNAGMKILVRTGDYIQRAGGSLWARKAYIDEHPDVPPKLIRAIAKAVMFYRDDKAGSIPILKSHLGIDNDKDAGIVWDQTHNTFGAELPKELFRQIFESRRQTMIKAKQWTEDKPLPDPEQFLMRKELDSTLKAMNYVPTKLDRPTN
jgi:ABC-type nitrate/sulfonate/bicarbonate transport system substrate-binding protein